MRRLLLFLIEHATPAANREWVLGDTVEEFDQIARSAGPLAAHRWLVSETCRVALDASTRKPGRQDAYPSDLSYPSYPKPRSDTPMTAILQDVRYAFRLLKRSPGFAGIAILTLALGIGANTAMFAVVNSVLLKPLPFKDPDRLMLAHLTVPDRENPGVFRETVWSYPKYRTFAAAQQIFEDTALFAGRDLNLVTGGEPERVRAEVVTDRYHAVLGIDPILGRTFRVDEASAAGAAPVAVIGHGLWTRLFAADREAIGKTVQLNGATYTIVGVLPAGFRGLIGDAQLWVPLGTMEPSQLTEALSHSYTVIARRKNDVPEAAAIAGMRVLGAQVDNEYAQADKFRSGAWGAIAVSLSASRADADVRRASLVLLGAVGCVLLIACVNLTNLIAAKAIARRREVAVRVAIGASRGRIFRQFLSEGLVLAGLGAATGLALAWGLLTAASVLLPDSDTFFRTAIAPGTPRITGAAGLTRIGAATIGLDLATLLFTAGVAVVTAVLVSLLPALQASSARRLDALKDGGRAMTERGLHGLGARTLLVTAQIALTLVLLAGAGLMIRSAARLYGTSIGVTPDRILTVRLDLPRPQYTPETGPDFYNRLIERVRGISGVESVALANCPPVSGGCNGTPMWPAGGKMQGGGRDPVVGIHWASPEYFATLGISLIGGRYFTDQDRTGQPKVVLVNEAAAKTHWPNDSPIGKRIAVGQGGFSDGAEIVGIVSNVRYRTIETAATPDVYVPAAQSFQARQRLFVKSRLDTQSLVIAIRREVRELDPNLPLSEIKTMDTRVGDAMWRTRVGSWLLAAFAGLALLLTAIGIFGVMAQTVTQRTAEIGIRMALGAQKRDVLSLLLGRATIVTAVGLVLGVACALALTRLISALLYGVQAHDLVTFVSVVAILAAVALGACYLPARRATRVDALQALREG